MNGLAGVTIDCVNPAALAGFWSAPLDRPVSAEHDGPGWATVGSRLDAAPRAHVPGGHELCVVQYL